MDWRGLADIVLGVVAFVVFIGILWLVGDWAAEWVGGLSANSGFTGG